MLVAALATSWSVIWLVPIRVACAGGLSPVVQGDECGHKYIKTGVVEDGSVMDLLLMA